MSRLTGVSLSEIRRIDAEPPIEQFDDAAERRRRGIGRPSKAEPFRRLLSDELARNPGATSIDLLERARRAGYSGGKSALYALLVQLRSMVAKSIGRVGDMPGDLSQHGFGDVDVSFGGGGPARVQFLVSRLHYSRWCEVSIVPDRGIESLLRGLVEHFARIGGVPLVTAFEMRNASAIGSTLDGFEGSWNPIFAQAMLDLGVGLEWYDRRRHKRASSEVEGLVRSVKSSFFRARRFADAYDLQRRLELWNRDVNTRALLLRTTKIVPAERISDERRRLRPLTVPADDFALRVPVVVRPEASVIYEGVSYPMPQHAVGKRGTLHLYLRRVVIAVAGFRSEHRRTGGAGAA